MLDRKMKIGITCYPTIGGSGVVATELGKLMAERGHEVHFVADSMPFRLGNYHPNIYYHEVEVNDYSVFRHPPYDLALASKLAQVAKHEKLDLLHVHYALPHAVSAFLAKEIVGPHLKILTTLHGTDITVLGHDESLKDLIRLAIQKSDAVTAVSGDLINETRSLLNVVSPINLVYNFIDPRYYHRKDVTELRRQFAAPHERIMLHISNFRKVKRVGDVLDVFNLVQKQVPTKMILVGVGPELSRMHCKVREMGLEDSVRFLGKQDDVTRVICMADLLILPSEKESFGLVALEAMACGVPVVASQVGGLPELVKHGQTGYLASVGDIGQMTAYALKLFNDPVLLSQFSDAALERAHQEFSADKIATQYEELYCRTLKSGCAIS